jgi:para-nitrobenzyl esterase
MKSVLLAIAIAAVPCMSMAAGTTGKVQQGVLQGTKESGLAVYRGIPFAAPPVGELRWRAPQPAARWEGVRPGREC